MVDFGSHVTPAVAPTDVVGPGAPWLRIILRPNEDIARWIDVAHAAGGKVLGVLARESFPIGSTRLQEMRYYAAKYRSLDAIEAGNEPDVKSPSSWTMPPKVFSTLLRNARKAWPSTMLVCGGLASGQISKLKGVDLGSVDAVALHVYGRGTDDHPYPGGGFGTIRDLVALYRPLGKPLVVTEYGGPGADFDSEHDRAAYIGGVMQGLAAEDLEFAIHFCWSDAMVEGFGLTDAAGTAKESYAAFYAAAENLAGDPPSDEPEDWTAPMFAWAERQYGRTPYAFGGDRTPDGNGPWDCAGFVSRAFMEIGVDIDPAHPMANTNAERLRLACDPVDSPEIGDLAFFQNTYPTIGASHVGIVIDPNGENMADDHQRSATSGPGETWYGSDYWGSHLMGYGRVRLSADRFSRLQQAPHVSPA